MDAAIAWGTLWPISWAVLLNCHRWVSTTWGTRTHCSTPQTLLLRARAFRMRYVAEVFSFHLSPPRLGAPLRGPRNPSWR
eukprot:3960638-Pyramimonas_sp.AAC.1